LLTDPEAAKEYEALQNETVGAASAQIDSGQKETRETSGRTGSTATNTTGGGVTAGPRSFHGTVEVAPATAKMRLVQIADEIVSVLVSDPNASVKVVVEISAEFPDGAKDSVKRAVSENARDLGLKSADWE
jgi:hypothetical protein